MARSETGHSALPESGTASVIRWQREGKTAPFAPVIGLLDEVENGPVFQIVTPRRDQPRSAFVEAIIAGLRGLDFTIEVARDTRYALKKSDGWPSMRVLSLGSRV